MLRDFRVLKVLSICLVPMTTWASGAGKSPGRVVTTRIGVQVPRLEFTTQSKELGVKELKYKPNAPSKTFLSFAYDWVGLSVGAVNPVAKEQELLYGESKAEDYQLRFYFENFSAELFHQIYTGYYIENTEDFESGFNSSMPRRQFPGLKTKHLGASLTWIMDPSSYSMAASFDQSVQQTKSGGSYLLNLTLAQNTLANSDVFIPSELQASYGEFGKIKSIETLTGTIGGGGGYNFVFGNHYYLSGLFVLNLGTHSLNIEKTTGSSTESLGGTSLHVKLGLGYNGDDFITGLSLASDANSAKIEKVDLSFQTYEVLLFVGTRFGL